MNEDTHKKYNGVGSQLLQTLVPVNSLTSDHLDSLMRDCNVETMYAGQEIFSLGEYDGKSVYLLSGQVELRNSLNSVVVDADNPDSRFPLSHGQPREYGACAKTDCSIIRFDSDALDKMLAWDQASSYILLDIAEKRDLDEDADWMITLLNSNLFYKVPPINIRQIIGKFVAEYVHSGETIIRQGEIGDCCYFIKEGTVGVYRAGEERAASELITELGVGTCFGEDALVNDVPRNASVIMRSNGVLMKLKKHDFFLLLKKTPVNTVSVSAAQELVEVGAKWIDVRSQDEYERGHCVGALNIPLDLLKLKSRLLAKDQVSVLYCNSGRRSEAAAYFLQEEGYEVSVLSGGMDNCPEPDDLFSHR